MLKIGEYTRKILSEGPEPGPCLGPLDPRISKNDSCQSLVHVISFLVHTPPPNYRGITFWMLETR